MPPTPRIPLTIRVRPDALAAIDKAADQAGMTRSEWLRTAVGLALATPGGRVTRA